MKKTRKLLHSCDGVPKRHILVLNRGFQDLSTVAVFVALRPKLKKAKILSREFDVLGT